jgi:hypothetical protein
LRVVSFRIVGLVTANRSLGVSGRPRLSNTGRLGDGAVWNPGRKRKPNQSQQGYAVRKLKFQGDKCVR